MFTASNGVKITEGLASVKGIANWHIGDAILRHTKEEKEALREYFLVERDKELGRWRWPDNPEIYVRPMNDDVVAVVYEHAEGTAYGQFERNGVRNRITVDGMVNAARAYFEAHPEPKPWHNAKHNEIWALFVAICDEAYRVDVDAFVPVNNPGRVRIPLTDERVKKARRIWPEN